MIGPGAMRTLDQIIAKLPPERRARIEAGAQKRIAEEMATRLRAPQGEENEAIKAAVARIE